METPAQRIFARYIYAEGEDDLPLDVIVDRRTSTFQGKEKAYPLRREHQTKEGGTYLREKICSV